MFDTLPAPIAAPTAEEAVNTARHIAWACECRAVVYLMDGEYFAAPTANAHRLYSRWQTVALVGADGKVL